jgi:hypothetical protein
MKANTTMVCVAGQNRIVRIPQRGGIPNPLELKPPPLPLRKPYMPRAHPTMPTITYGPSSWASLFPGIISQHGKVEHRKWGTIYGPDPRMSTTQALVPWTVCDAKTGKVVDSGQFPSGGWSLKPKPGYVKCPRIDPRSLPVATHGLGQGSLF